MLGMTNTQDLLTTFEAAELAGVKPDTIKAWKRQRLLVDAGRKGPHGVALYDRTEILSVMRQKGIALPAQKQDELPVADPGCERCEYLERELAEIREGHGATFKEIIRLAVNAD